MPILDALGPVIGGTITDVATSDGDTNDRPYYGLVVTSPTGQKRVVWFFKDDEGNGPGSFHVQKLPDEKVVED